MPLIHTEALTLRRRRIRESDALLTLFTRDRGKMTVSLRGVVKTSSKYAGVSQPFNHLHVVLYAAHQEQEIWSLTQSSLIRQYAALQSEIQAMAAAACLVEWVEALSAGFDAARPVWKLLHQAFSLWDSTSPAVEQVMYFQWHLLLDAGLLPELSHCVGCHIPASPHWVYHPKAGGIVCECCSQGGLSISAGSLQVVRLMLKNGQPPAIRLSKMQQQEIMQMMKRHIEYHADFSSATLTFFGQIRDADRLTLAT